MTELWKKYSYSLELLFKGLSNWNKFFHAEESVKSVKIIKSRKNISIRLYFILNFNSCGIAISYFPKPSLSSIASTIARTPAENSWRDLLISVSCTVNQSPLSSGVTLYLTPRLAAQSCVVPVVWSTNSFTKRALCRMLLFPNVPEKYHLHTKHQKLINSKIKWKFET